MEESAKSEVVQKRSWMQGLKGEFKKVVWPERESVIKNTIAVVSASIVLGLVIAGLDAIIKMGLSFLMNL